MSQNSPETSNLSNEQQSPLLVQGSDSPLEESESKLKRSAVKRDEADIKREEPSQTSVSLLPKGWTEEQDQRLLELCAHWKGKWKKIAKKFDHVSITPLFLKNRFNEVTAAPPQRRSKFHASEDLMLAKYFEQYGPDWAKIATHFQNRTPVMLKNRYYSFIKKKDIMDSLIQKVRSLEDKDILVDNIKDERSQRYCEIDLNLAPSSLGINQAHSGGTSSNGEANHPIFGFEKPPSSFMPAINSKCLCPCVPGQKDNEAASKSESAQIAILIEQLAIYRSLYFSTKAELNDLKAKMNAEDI